MRGLRSETSDTLNSPCNPSSQSSQTNISHRLPTHQHAGAALLTVILLLSTLLGTLLLSPPPHDHRMHRHLFSSSDDIPQEELVSIVCKHTVYPDVCEKELANYYLSSPTTPLDIVKAAVQAAARRVNEAQSLASKCSGERGISKLEGQCAYDCVELLHGVNDAMAKSAARISTLSSYCDVRNMQSALGDVKVWLSSALSYQTACSDNFQVAPGTIQQQIQSNQAYLGQVIGFTLSLVDILARIGNDMAPWLGALPPTPPFVHGPLRRLLSAGISLDADDGFPHWVSAGERRLLQASSPSVTALANVIVAKDGRGSFTNITVALNAIPASYSGRYVMYIKKGVYEEVFNVTKDLQNLTFIGDGIGQTIITGARNVASGDYNTYRTSTVGISAGGFFARDITFRNTAGPSGHQAVALRAGADYMVFYRCSFEGYQDTLYALSSRQFYRECRILGTVDFIFGNAIAVFQNCELVARLPMQGQQNTYTAQGRKLEADVSGYAFQNCTVTGEAAIATAGYTVGTYLGRPWKEYSRVVFLQSELQGLVDPKGWLPWNASNPFTDTVYYGEYANRGGGADTSRRVNWTGVHPNLSQADASLFTLSNFIAAQSWLDSLQVTYQASL
ncbi:hypothetical protein L7F22_001348 [Adiantum nelumboides]|nr:hypothetical protein [Adiantum nelumboides]